MTGRNVPDGVKVSFDRTRVASRAKGEPLEDSGVGAAPDDRVPNPTRSLDLEDLGLEISVTSEHLAAIVSDRVRSISQVYSTLDVIKTHLDEFFPAVPEILPGELTGRLLNPDGTDAQYVSVRALEPASIAAAGFDAPWTNPETTTDARGAFLLRLPPRPVGDNGLALAVTGANRSTEVTLRRTDLIAGNGKLGVIPLDVALTPLPRSVVARLGDIVLPTGEDDLLENPAAFATPSPVITLGDEDCAKSFRSNVGVVDRYRYSVLIRLIEPHLSSRRLGVRVGSEDAGNVLLSASSLGMTKYVGANQLIEAMATLGSFELVERVPIEAPIDVTSFLDLIERDPKRVPKAATLGLGYVLTMRQLWIPTGLSLGDLVYSLPLAPGEQQRIAVAEERETLSVREMESLTATEFQRYNEVADSSTDAVFTSAFHESASGGSRMRTRSKAGVIGGGLALGGIVGGIVAGLGVGGGYSDSSTTGSTSSWQKASRDYASSASQDFHSSLLRQASARRTANRTSVRLATATESREVVTKVITNHNHNHALTMQYWQVLRHFAVTSAVDDVQLVCFVPLEIVQFLDSFQPRTLPTGNYTRDLLLSRYRTLLRYHDVLESRLGFQPDMLHGLRVLRAFAGNPTMTVQSSGGAAQDIVNVRIDGTFLPFEDIYVTAISTSGARVGPIRLVGASVAIGSGHETRAELMQALRTRRAGSFETRTGALALPDYIARSDIARLEFTRRFDTFSYRLALPSSLSFTDILGYLSHTASLDVTLRSATLEQELGGPLVRDPVATLSGGTDLLEAYNGPGGTEIMGAVLPVAARRLPPELSFADLLRIEAVLNHVVQNTVEYSKAVWQALTPEERAIMLEPYTIGVPSGGVVDASEEVPLLNCVANVVLGYFGNAAVMPFFIPPQLAGEIGHTSRDVQEALLRFHRQAFAPPQSSITLPARGVLGEAVLGSCESSEKIDLTRFWNWQDSPPDTATDPAQLAELFGGGNRLVGPSGATAPAELQAGGIVTINQGPAALTPADLATALIASLPESNLPQDLTGLQQLAAQMKVQTATTATNPNKTIEQASGLAKAAMESIPEVIKAKKGATEEKKPGGATAGTGGTGAGGSGGTGAGGTGGTGGSGGGGATIDGGPAPS